MAQWSWRNIEVKGVGDLCGTFSGTGCGGPEAPADEKRAWLSSAHPCVAVEDIQARETSFSKPLYYKYVYCRAFVL